MNPISMNASRYTYLFVLTACCLFALTLKAQTVGVCSSNALAPVFKQDFGTGTSSTSSSAPAPSGSTNYTYSLANVGSDGYYALTPKFDNAGKPEWTKGGDHTSTVAGNPANGNMFLVNAGGSNSIFFQQDVNSLCPGSTYNFSAWLANANTPATVTQCGSSYVYAKVRFNIKNAADGTILQTYVTPDLPLSPNNGPANWIQYGFQFSVPSSVSQLRLEMVDERGGGAACGNDLAIDDIEFYACTPLATASINTPTSVCIGSTAIISSTLSNNPFLNPVYQWEKSTNGGSTWTAMGSPSTTATSLTITAVTLSDAALYRVKVAPDIASLSSVYCTTASNAVTLSVSPLTVGGSVSSATVCSGTNSSVTLSGYTGSVVRWESSTDNGATWNNISNTTATQFYTAIATTQYRALVQSGVCSAEYATPGTVTVISSVPGTISSAATVCSGANSGTLTLGAYTGSILRWETSTNGGSTWTQVNNTTNTLSYSNLTATTQYRALVKNGSCAQQYSPAVTITVIATVAGTLSSAATECSGSNGATLTLTGYSGSILRWESSTDGGNTWDVIANTTASYTYSNLTTTTRYRVVVQNGSCATLTSNVVIITVNTINGGAISPAATTVCSGSNSGTLTLSGYDGAIVRWERSTNNGISWTSIGGTANDVTYSYSNLTATTSYRAVIRKAPCPDEYSAVAVVTPASTSAGTLGTAATVCAGNNTGTLNLTGYTGSIVRWESAANAAGPWTTISNTSDNHTYNNISASTYYRAVVKLGSCASANSNSVLITTTAPPTTSNAGTDQTLCNVTSATLAGNTPSSGTGTWTQVSGPTTVSFVNAAAGNTVVNGLTTGAYQFRWTIANSPCASSSSVVNVTVAALPTTADAGTDQALCNTTTTTLAGNNPAVGTGTWTRVSGPNMPSFNASQYNTTVTGLTAGTYQFRWTIANGSCVSSASVVNINVDPATVPGTLSSNNTVCATSNNGTINLAGYTGAIVRWESSTDNGNTWNNIANTTAAYTYNNLNTTTQFRAVVKSGVCAEAASNIVTITVTQPVTIANAGTDQALCNATATTLAANNPTIGTGAWTQVSGPTTTSSYNAAQYNTTVTGLAAGTYQFRWTISNSPCASSSDVVNISIDPATVPGTLSSDNTVCSGSNNGTISLAGYTGSITRWESSTDNGNTWNTIVNTTAAYTYNNLSTTTQFRAFVKSGVCTEAASNIVTITVDPVTIPGTLSSNNTVCATSNNGTINLTGYTGSIVRWESSTDNGNTWNTIANITAAYTYNNLNTTTQFRAFVKSGVCAEAASNIVTITVDPVTVPGTLSSNNTVCAAANNGTINLTGYTGAIVRWESSTDNGNTWNIIANTTAAYTYNNLNTTTQFRAFVKSGVCAEAASNIVTITVDPVTVPGTLSANNTVCATSNNGTINLTGYTGSIVRWESSTDNGNTWNTIVNTTAAYTYNNLNTTTQFRAFVKSGVCAEAASSIVTITVDPVTVPGTLSANNTVCATSNNGTITLTGYTGAIVRWESSTDNGNTWNTIANTTAAYTYSNLNATIQFRAFVKSGVCSEAASNIVTITVDPVTVPGTLSSNNTVCATSNNGTINLTGYTGSIVRWESSTDNGNTWNTIINTTSAYTYSNLNTTTQFRAFVKSGVCAEAASNIITITVDPVTVPGTLSSNNTVCATSNNGTINLTGYTGTIVRWESSTDNGNTWNIIANTTAAYTYSNLNTTTQFRAFVKSGVCSEAASNIVTITVMQAVTPANAGTAQVLCNTTTTTLAANNPTVGTGAWTQVSGPTSASFNNAAQYNTTVSGLTAGTYQFRWTISNSPCASSNDVVTVSIDPATVPGTLSSDNTVCATSNNGTITLAGYTGAIVRWESSTDNGNTWNTIANTTAAYTYNNLNTTTQFRAFVKSGVCAETASNIVTITVDPVTVPGTLSSNNTVCATSNNGTINLTGYTGSIVRWESSTDNGNTWNTIANTTSAYTYSNLNTTTQFRAFVKSGVCSEAASNIVTITVDPATVPGTLSSNNTVCATSNNGTINLTGYTGAIVRWESSTDNGNTWNIIANTTAAYTYNNLNTTTQFRAFVKSGVCSEAASNIVTITVDPATLPGTLSSNNTVCATSNNGTINLAGYTGSIVRWESSTDNGNTWNTIVNTTAAYTYNNLNTTTQFRAFVKSGVCAEAASNIVTITVDPVTVPGTLSANNTVCVTSNNGTINLTGYTGSIVRWESSTDNGNTWNTIGNTTAAYTYNNLNTTTQFRAFVKSGVCAEAASNIVTITVDPVTVPGTLSSDNTVCATSNNGTINLTGYTGSIVRWESSTDNGNTWNTIANTTAAYTYNNLNTTTQFRAFVKSGVCSEAASNIVTITVMQAVTPANAGTAQVLCNTTTTTLAANNPAVGTGAWAQVSGPTSASFNNTAQYNTTVSGLTAGTYQFRWTISNSPCASSSDVVTVSIDPATVPGTLSSNNTVCATSNNGTINLTGYTGSIVRWESSTDNGNTWNTIVNTTAAYTYSNLNTTTQFRAFVKSGVCAEAASNIVTITVMQAVTPANAGTAQVLCNTTTTTLAANNPAVGTGAWIQVSGPTSASFNNAAQYNTTVSGLTAGTYQFRWTISNSPCASSNDVVTVSIDPATVPGTLSSDNTVCATSNNGTINLTGYTGSIVRWESSTDNGNTWNTIINTTAAYTYSNLNTTTQFRAFVKSGVCAEAASNIVIITVDPVTVPGTLSSNNTVCATSNNGTINLTGNTGTIVRWESSTDNGNTWNTIANITDACTYNNLNTTTQFRAFVKSGVCAEVASNIVTITVMQAVTPANAGTAQVLCNTTTTTLAANNPAVGTGAWTQVSGPTTASFNNGAQYNTTVSGLTSGTYQFRWTISNSPCASSNDVVTVSIDPATVPGTLSSNNTVCATSNSGTINLTGYTGAIVRWESSTDNGNTWNTIVNTTAAYIYNNLNTTTQFRAFVKSGVCSEAASNIVTITVDPVTVPGTLSSNNTVCATSNNGTINLTGYTGSIVRWESSTDNGNTWNTIVNTTAAYTYSNLNTTTQFRAFVKSGVCSEAASNIVTITVMQAVTPANAGTAQVLCNTTTTTLAANNPTVGTGAWAQVSGPTTASFNNAAQYNTTVSGLTAGTYQFRWTISNSPCASSSDVVTVSIDPATVPGTLSSNNTVCATSNNGTINLTGYTGSIVRWESSTDNGNTWNTIANTTAAYTYNNLSTTTQFRAFVKSGVCGEAASNIVTITVDPVTLPGTLSSSNTVCATGNNGTINLTGHTGAIVRWESSTDNGNTWNTIVNTTAAYTYSNLNITTQFRALVKSGVCAEAASNIVTITVDPVTVPGTLSSNNTVCATSNNGTINLTGYTGTIVRWESSTDNGNTWNAIANTTAAYTYNNLNTTTQFRAFVKSGVCSETASNIVTIIVMQAVTPANAGAAQVLCNTTTTTLAANNPAVGTGAWTQVSGPTTASFNNAAQYNTTVTGLAAGTYQFRWTISNNPCASSNDVVTVSIDPATVAGTLSANNTVCATANNGTINLTGYTGAIVRWEASTDNGSTWNIIVNTTAAYTYSNLNTTTQFRAFVKSGVCVEAASNIVTIKVDQPVIPGTLTGDNTICAGTNSGSINLSANSGNVSHWEYSTNNGSSWNIIANTGISLTYQNLSATTLYRALIVNGTCTSAYTNIVMINVAQPVTTANAGPAQVVCGSSSVMLAANQPASGTGTWISLLGPSAVSFNNNTLPNATVSGLIPGQYQLAWIVSNGVCPSSISSTFITIDATSVGGTVAGSTTVCEGASGSVSLSGYTGNVTGWQTSTDLGQTWNTISNNTSVFTYTNITTTTQFRAIVRNGSCNIAYSETATITVNSKPDAGTLAASNTVCVTGNQGKLQLSGYNGTISRWESSTDNGNSWSAIQHTVSEYQFNNLTNSTQYRVQVQNGVCAPVYSNPVTITTDAATVSGTLKGDAAVCAGKNNGNISLSGNTGAVMHWEVSENNGATWRVLNLQSNVYAYSDLSVTSVFRALVQNGVCASLYSNPVTITVSQVPTQANAGADQLFCNGTQTAQLRANIPAEGNGRWSMISGPVNASISNRNQSATTVNGLRAGTYQFAWTISNGSCIASVDTVKITVDTIRAGFKLTSIFDCGKTTFNFTDTTQTVSRIASWKWSLTPGDTVTTKNHNVSFTQPGDHSVSLTTTSINGCNNTIKADFKVDIYEFPKVDINMIGDACKDQLLQLTPSVNSKDSIAYMLWKLGNGVNANDVVVNAQYTSEGSYTVRLIVSTINNCFDSAYKSINIHPTPSITISKDQQICKGDTVRLTASGAVNYIWMDQNNNVVCNGCSETSVKPALSGQYKVVGYNQFGCSEVKTTSVRVIQPFRMNAIQGDTICVGQSRRLSATGASNYKWYPETGLSNTTIATPVAQPLVTTTYKVIGKDNYNCFTDTAEVKIVVGNPTPFSLGKDTIVTAGNNYQLKILSGAQDIVKWRWSGSPAITCATCPEPQIRVSEDACITCTAINIYGCASTDTVCIKTFCPATELFVPNAFSPDGDGINDLLIVQGKGIKMIKSFRIFNRWGQVVFEKSNFLPGDAANAWDGKIMGRPANADVFVYVCEVICEKGLPSIFKGNVTILK